MEPKTDNNRTFEIIGGVLGIAYGIYFTKEFGGVFANKYLNYLWWMVIFALAFHEIGEQVDRKVIPAIKSKF